MKLGRPVCRARRLRAPVVMTRRATNIVRHVVDYVRRDLREIVWPRPMDDPPGTRYLKDMSVQEHARAFRETLRMYTDGWRWYNGEPERERRERVAAERLASGEDASTSGEHDDAGDDWKPDPDDTSTMKDELGRIYGAGARVGADGWRRELRRFYETRGVAYMDAMKQFVAGYKEGVAQANEPLSELERSVSRDGAERFTEPSGRQPGGTSAPRHDQKT